MADLSTYLRRYWPDSDPDRNVEIASQRAMSAFCILAGLSGVAVTLTGLQNWSLYALNISIGAFAAGLCLVSPLWLNTPTGYALKSKVFGGVILALLGLLAALSGSLVTPSNLLIIPCVMTFALAIGWRAGLAAMGAAIAGFSWNYSTQLAGMTDDVAAGDLTTIFAAFVMSSLFVFTGAIIFRVEMMAAATRLRAAKTKAEIAMERFRILSDTDALTGVSNRRAFMRRLGKELAAADESGSPVSLVMFDLDHFKRVNDTHGHAVGDRVLVETVRVARPFARQGGRIGRLGGEEFALLLPGVTETQALDVAEDLRLRIAAMAIGDTTGRLVPVTTSLGVASHDRAVETDAADDILARADDALYAAKRDGRNCVRSDRVDLADPEQQAGSAA